tara:strand:+ start:7758 stop:9698 length:1941 start_codon:yes stop_codon:yes gene_type:complete
MGRTELKGTQIKDESIDSVDIASGSIKKGELNAQAVSSQTAITTVDTTNDMLLIFDATDSALKKVAPTNLGIGSPAGSDTQVQYNNGGVTAGASTLIVNDTNKRVGIGYVEAPLHLLHMSGSDSAAVLRIEGKGDVGIRLGADNDNSGEGDNPYVAFFQDGLSSVSMNNRLFTIALEGDAEATFDGSIANTPYLDSSYGGGTSARPFQIATGNGTDHSARLTIATDGNMGIGTSTPSAHFHVDTSTNDDVMQISTSGSASTLYVSGSGNIGIGTTIPTALLHISSSTPGVLFRIDHPDSTIDNPIFFVTGSAGQSKVGIGTETPDATFAISDDGKVFEVGSAAEGSWFEVNNGNVLFNASGGTTQAGGIFLGQRFSIAPINATYGALGIGKYPGSTVNILEVNSANSDQGGDFFVIDSDGQVGIGTTSPNALLHIDNGTANTEFIIEKDAGTSGSIVFHNAGSREAEIAFSTNEDIEITNRVADKDITLNIVSGSTEATALTVDASTGTVTANKQFARGVASLNLGSGTTSTLDPSVVGAGTILVTASSATTPTSGALEGLHLCTIPDGNSAGQILTVCIITDALDGSAGAASTGLMLFSPSTPIPSSATITVPGSGVGGTPEGASFTLLWTGSGWMRLAMTAGAS